MRLNTFDDFYDNFATAYSKNVLMNGSTTVAGAWRDSGVVGIKNICDPNFVIRKPINFWSMPNNGRAKLISDMINDFDVPSKIIECRFQSIDTIISQLPAYDDVAEAEEDTTPLVIIFNNYSRMPADDMIALFDIVAGNGPYCFGKCVRFVFISILTDGWSKADGGTGNFPLELLPKFKNIEIALNDALERDAMSDKDVYSNESCRPRQRGSRMLNEAEIERITGVIADELMKLL